MKNSAIHRNVDRSSPQLYRDDFDNLENAIDSLLSSIDSDPANTIQPPSDLPSLKKLKEESSVTRRLQLLDDAGGHLKQLSHKLGLARQSVKRRSDQLRRQLTPINLLPVEIIHHIFLLIVGQTVRDPREINNRFQHALRVSHVCRSWRAIALQEKDLWSSLHLSYPRGDMKLFASRSGTNLMDVGLDIRNAVDLRRWEGSYSADLAYERWRSLIITDGLDNLDRGLSTLLTRTLPNLEYFDLRSPVGERSPVLYAPEAQTYPKLRHLRLEGFVEFNTSFGAMHTLVNLSLECFIVFPDLEAISESCFNLETFQLSLVRYEDTLLEINTPLPIPPRLRSFVIMGLDPDELAAFLRCYGIDGTENNLQNFGFRLKSFERGSLHNEDNFVSGLAAFFRRVPHIVEFRAASGVEPMVHLLDMLKRSYSRSTSLERLLPTLQSLYLCPYALNVDDGLAVLNDNPFPRIKMHLISYLLSRIPPTPSKGGNTMLNSLVSTRMTDEDVRDITPLVGNLPDRQGYKYPWWWTMGVRDFLRQVEE